MPKIVGIWIIGVEDTEITKWGKDGGTEFPLPPDTPPRAIKKMVANLRQGSERNSRFYIFEVFETGQMRHSYATNKDS